MIDQHKNICEKHGIDDPTAGLEKIGALYDAFKNSPKLKNYFESDFHKTYAHNHPGAANHKGVDDAEYGETVTTQVEPKKKKKEEGEKKEEEKKEGEEEK